MKKIFLLLLIITLTLCLFISCAPTTPSEGEGEPEDPSPGSTTDQVILVEEAGWGEYSTPEIMERFSWYVTGTKHTPFIAINGLNETLASVGAVGGGGGSTPSPEPEPEPEPEGEVLFVIDINPENDLILVAGIEGGEKIVTLGEKDASGNPISITGALYLTGQGEGLAIEVGVDGLPTKIVDSDGNKFTFENYTASTVDISIYDFEENLIEGPITIEIDPNDISRMQQLYQSFFFKSRWDAHNTADIFEYTSVAIGAVGCGLSIFAAATTGGLAIPLALIACSSALHNAYTVSHPNADPILTDTEGTTLNVTGNILNIVFKDKFTPWGIAGTVSGMIGSVIETGATKMDIIEVHNEFLLAIVNQDWYEAKKLCVEGSESYNMVCGVEIVFANESLNPDNSSIEISQNIDNLLIADRPIAHMYNTAEITMTAEGFNPPVYFGEEYYGYLEEVSLNKWKKVESAILKIMGAPPLGPLPNPTLYDPGDTVNSEVEYNVSWSDESEHGAIDYFIKEDTSPDFDPNSPNYSGSWAEGTSKSFSHQVDQDTTYYYRVRSYAGNTVWSEAPGSNIESITVLEESQTSNAIHNISKDTYYDTIQVALDDANSGDTIEVDDGTYDESIDFPSGKVIILQSINGASSNIIRGNDDSNTVTFDGSLSGTTLEGFTITHKGGDTGKGIDIDSSNVNINNCIVSNNHEIVDYSYAGGIDNSYSTITISGCTISGNSSQTGGIDNSYSTMIISNCIISDNTGTKVGGIDNFLDSTMIISNCIISDNTGDSFGGGIGNYTNSELTISESTISGNIADIGGAIRNMTGASLTIKGCDISNNEASYNGGGILISADSGLVSIGGNDANDTSNFNIVCGNKTNGIATVDNQINPNIYPYNNISATCGGNGNDPIPDVLLMAHTYFYEFIPGDIDLLYDFSLGWNAYGGADGYRVYRSINGSSFEKVFDGIPSPMWCIWANRDYTWCDHYWEGEIDSEAGDVYSYYVTAYGNNLSETNPSEILSATLLPPCLLNSPNGLNPISVKPEFNFSHFYLPNNFGNITNGRTKLKVYDNTSNSLAWEIILNNLNIFNVIYDQDNNAAPLENNHKYDWWVELRGDNEDEIVAVSTSERWNFTYISSP